jgi:hypothetical protein
MQGNRIYRAARDFDKLRYMLPKGTAVYIKTRGNIHRATFSGDRFHDDVGNSFTSPYSFSTHVTRLYRTSGGVPSGWYVIKIVDSHSTQSMTLADIYDASMGIIFRN